MQNPILVVIRGLPGSGKTTLAQRFAADGFQHYEADHYFYRNGAYSYIPEELPIADQQCLTNTDNALAQGNHAVVANTFILLSHIKPYAELAQKHNATLVVLVAHGQWPNVHGVPDYRIENMMRRWQPLKREKWLNPTQLSHMALDEIIGQAQEV